MIKNQSSLSAFVATFLVMLFAAGCSETEVLPDSQTDITSEDESARKSKAPIAAFTYNERTYDLSYNPAGTVSTIIALQDGVEIYR